MSGYESIPSVTDTNHKKVLEMLKRNVEKLFSRGNPLDRPPTIRELKDAGIINARVINTPGGTKEVRITPV